MLTLPELLAALDESNTELFERLWDVFTPEELAEILAETEAVEQAGGEATADGSRQRTKGGVFLRLLREKHRERYHPILRDQNNARRKKQMETMRADVQKMDKDVVCPQELIGQLIGKAGQGINILREKSTGCKIKVDEEGRIRVNGENEEQVDAARAIVQEHVTALILKTHAEYSDAVLLSEFMSAGHRGELVEGWATTLYGWVQLTIEQSPKTRLRSTLHKLAAAAPRAVRSEMAAQFEANPKLLGENMKVAQAIQSALASASEPSTPASSVTTEPLSLRQGPMLPCT
jgi:hypothetical protein